jgi:hypothetical protein
MILGRLIRRTDSAEYSLIRVNWLTKIFVGGDIFCLYVPKERRYSLSSIVLI